MQNVHNLASYFNLTISLGFDSLIKKVYPGKTTYTF